MCRPLFVSLRAAGGPGSSTPSPLLAVDGVINCVGGRMAQGSPFAFCATGTSPPCSRKVANKTRAGQWRVLEFCNSMRMGFMAAQRLLRLQGWCKSCVGRRLLCSSMAFFGRFVARPAITGCVKVGSVARHAEVPGAMEQDPSPACTAWASPGLPPDSALALLCLVHSVPLAPGLVLSHQHRVRCVRSITTSVSRMSS